MEPERLNNKGEVELDEEARAAVQEGIEWAADGRRWTFEEAKEEIGVANA